MKITELERKLRKQGCYFVKHGKRHDLWFSPITIAISQYLVMAQRKYPMVL